MAWPSCPREGKFHQAGTLSPPFASRCHIQENGQADSLSKFAELGLSRIVLVFEEILSSWGSRNCTCVGEADGVDAGALRSAGTGDRVR